ncbi:acyltransferase family protein [Streptosporangium saharense]|uniref:Peptidoglycan/LPS O-acetylase OafA/YrhL n=1 Tax=Streptosporangium saharense TaxID=1706840 RepID=A0A7W7QID6_9ACTN|nr:acyltransferase [Streptosporangium saharense]MBB4914048.1 peptidoglycan/LPS O-acetylase OafA/YrhL [Streptosporangium saharense]
MSPPAALPTPTPAPPPPVTGQRLAWLDALRGLGAVAVLLEHLLPWFMPALRPYWFNLGMYGVLVFFLVSGYIIPVSLEGRGDVRAFWISRAFRLYPIYLLVVGFVLVMAFWLPVREQVPRGLEGVAGHVTMLMDVLHMGGLADTMWTLSYEMVFYLLVTALFVRGLHLRSGLVAVVFGVVGIGAGLVLSAPLLGGPWPAYVAGVLFCVGMACVVGGRFRTVAACVLGVMAVVLTLFSGFVPWLGATILAVMFTGTAIRRWEQGTGGIAPVAAAAVLVALAPVWSIQAGWWWVQPGVWFATVGLAAATFAGAMALRGRRLPRPVVWLGLISYSLYLLHHPLLRLFHALVGDVTAMPQAVQLSVSAAFLAVVVGLSWLTYRYVELPMQRLGRRLAHRPSSGEAASGASGESGVSAARSSFSEPTG